jgi:hypothetical protein
VGVSVIAGILLVLTPLLFLVYPPLLMHLLLLAFMLWLAITAVFCCCWGPAVVHIPFVSFGIYSLVSIPALGDIPSVFSQCCGSGSSWICIIWGSASNKNPNLLDPVPQQFADDKPKMNGILTYLSTFSRV